jgi:hypothetical protein
MTTFGERGSERHWVDFFGTETATIFAVSLVFASTSAQAEQTMEQFRPVFAEQTLRSCLSGGFGKLSPTECGCYSGYLADNITVGDAVAGSNGIATASFDRLLQQAANACVR